MKRSNRDEIISSRPYSLGPPSLSLALRHSQRKIPWREQVKTINLTRNGDVTLPSTRDGPSLLVPPFQKTNDS